jgi:hypothetical protein
MGGIHRSTDGDMVFLQTVAGAVNATTAAQGKKSLVMLLSCGVCTKKGGEGKFLVVSDGCTDPIHKDVAAAMDGRGGVSSVRVTLLPPLCILLCFLALHGMLCSSSVAVSLVQWEQT